MTTVLMIPAYNPDAKMVPLLADMPADVFEAIVVINDGSSPSYDPIFDQLKQLKNVILLEHDQNQGKGAALKTGFAHVLDHIERATGVITADADGQHTRKDILALAEAFEPGKKCLTIGSRAFDRDVPFRSAVGNRLTRWIMKWFFKINLSDTQSGLRAIPRPILPELLQIPYDRYEFEIEMLTKARKMGYGFNEITVETIYENNNAASSFNPVVDSAKIYFVLFRYVLASLATAAVDYLVFFIAYSFVPKIFLCTYLARMIALFVNFVILKQFVFKSREKNIVLGIKYGMLVIVSGFVSSLVIDYFNTRLNYPIIVSKIAAELLLYFAIFIVQKEFVFNRGEKQ